MQLSEKILGYLDVSKPGIFIEAGANDGVTQSNTYKLEKEYGWTGILVEPSSRCYENCLKIRQNSKVYNYCLVSEEYSKRSIEGDFDGNLMSSVDGGRLNRNPSVQVAAITLQNLLDINNISKVDFFSLDTEGYEFQVLNGIDFERTKIDKILIEVYEHNKKEIFNLLSDLYSEPICVSNYNHSDNPGWDGTHNDYLFIRK